MGFKDSVEKKKEEKQCLRAVPYGDHDVRDPDLGGVAHVDRGAVRLCERPGDLGGKLNQRGRDRPHRDDLQRAGPTAVPSARSAARRVEQERNTLPLYAANRAKRHGLEATERARERERRRETERRRQRRRQRGRQREGDREGDREPSVGIKTPKQASRSKKGQKIRMSLAGLRPTMSVANGPTGVQGMLDLNLEPQFEHHGTKCGNQPLPEEGKKQNHHT